MDLIEIKHVLFITGMISVVFIYFSIQKIIGLVKNINHQLERQIEKSKDFSKQIREINRLLLAIGHLVQGDECINCGERHFYSEEECKKKEKDMDEFLNSPQTEET